MKKPSKLDDTAASPKPVRALEFLRERDRPPRPREPLTLRDAPDGPLREVPLDLCVRQAFNRAIAEAHAAAAEATKADIDEWDGLHRNASLATNALNKLLRQMEGRSQGDPAVARVLAQSRLGRIEQELTLWDKLPRERKATERSAAKLLTEAAITLDVFTEDCERRVATLSEERENHRERAEFAAKSAFILTLAEAWFFITGRRLAHAPTGPFAAFAKKAWADWKGEEPEGGEFFTRAIKAAVKEFENGRRFPDALTSPTDYEPDWLEFDDSSSEDRIA